MQIENGTYAACATGTVEVGDHKNGCLIVNMEFALEDGRRISNTFWLTTKDGAVNTRSVETLKELFGWDGADPFWFEDQAETLKEIGVNLVVENETFTGDDGNQRTAPKVKWVNPINGNKKPMVANGDRAALMAKYGAKLRAVSGGKPAARPTPKAAQPSAAKAQEAPPVPSESDPKMVAWEALKRAMNGKTRSEVEAQWRKFVDTLGEDWPAVMSAISELALKSEELPY